MKQKFYVLIKEGSNSNHEPCWRIRNNRMTSKAFEIKNVYRKRGKTREYKEKREEKILCLRLVFTTHFVLMSSFLYSCVLTMKYKFSRLLKNSFIRIGFTLNKVIFASYIIAIIVKHFIHFFYKNIHFL